MSLDAYDFNSQLENALYVIKELGKGVVLPSLFSVLWSILWKIVYVQLIPVLQNMGCASSARLPFIKVNTQTILCWLSIIFEDGTKVSLVAANSFTASWPWAYLYFMRQVSAVSISNLNKALSRFSWSSAQLCEFNDDRILCVQAQPRFLWSRLQKKDITNKLLFIWTINTTYDYLYLVKMLLL